MPEETNPVDLAERVAQVAQGLEIETALIGAYALAAYGYVRATADVDLAVTIELTELERLERTLEDQGLSTELRSPDDEDPLGGCLVIWERTDEEGDPIDPVEVVNFLNSHQPRVTPARDAIRSAISLEGKPTLRYPALKYLIALKLYAGSLRDDADIVEVLARNPSADLEEIRSTCKRFGLDRIDELLAHVANAKRRNR